MLLIECSVSIMKVLMCVNRERGNKMVSTIKAHCEHKTLFHVEHSHIVFPVILYYCNTPEGALTHKSLILAHLAHLAHFLHT